MKFFIATLVTASAALTTPTFADEADNSDVIDSVGEYGQALIDSDDADLEARRQLSERAQARLRMRAVCKKVDLSEEQKVDLKDALFDYRESAIQLRADIRTARVKFIRAILDAEADAATATPIVNEGVTAKAALAQAKGDLASKVFFSILMAEQRKPALKCLVAWKKFRHEVRQERRDERNDEADDDSND